MNTHIQVGEYDPRYFQVGEDMLTDYAEEIEDILYRAYGDGVVITVEQIASTTLGMGHYDTELVVRPMRKPDGWPHTEVPDSHPLAWLFERQEIVNNVRMSPVPRQSNGMQYLLLACVVVGTIVLLALKS